MNLVYVCLSVYDWLYSECTSSVRHVDCLFMKYIFTIDQGVDIVSTTAVSIET